MKNRGLAHDAIDMISELYKVEKMAKEQQLNHAERFALRHKLAVPWVDKMEQWLQDHQDSVPPKSKLGAAISYATSEWPRMRNYLKDGVIEIDNNAAERAIKPFVIGRKNWLFCNSENGAFSSAVLYSLLQSAKANDLPIHEWLTYVLGQWPKCTTDEQRLALAPHSFDQKLLNLNLQDAVS